MVSCAKRGGQPASLAATKDNNGEEITLVCSDSSLVLVGDERWFLVHTQPNAESEAALHLGAQGFRTHLPRGTHASCAMCGHPFSRVTSSSSSTLAAIAFCRRAARWESPRSTAAGGRPIPVPEGVVEALIERSDEANLTLFQAGLKYGNRFVFSRDPLRISWARSSGSMVPAGFASCST
jgi:hypothetical protein